MDLPWVESLIQAKFYVTCQCGWKDSTYYCIQYLDLPFCEVCKTNKHSGHNVLQVCLSSEAEEESKETEKESQSEL
ncbi:PLATZ transcription factor family protein [Melia azedarach]|uniref:PLATZ transcription factor family protein n=1 Tax=Melia azedarach TaxID=155640 RepID=A0ACC1XUR8_MELAZ|nr:PLATZ transcription factor family protein [Melia azedarach]